MSVVDADVMDADVMEAVALDSDRVFLDRYRSLILSTWQDETVRDGVLADPTRAAIEAGLPVEAGSTVRVDPSRSQEFLDGDQILRDWTATAGTHLLHLPEQPAFDPSELTELDVEKTISAICVYIVIV